MAAMLNYPPTTTGICKYCGAQVNLERHGDGRPAQGRLKYWYATDHHCLEGDRAVEELSAERRLLEDALFTGP
jgi:hypothetical protein